MEANYSPSLVILSVLVAILASYVALNLAYSVTQAKGRAQLAWLSCGAIAMGIGIWSMHFVGMLAFEMPGMEMAYDIPLMILSVVVAILASALALFVVSRPIVQSGSLISGGIAMAAAISGMHYIGMYSMRMAARIQWNIYLVLLSIAIALAASFGALTISIRLRNKPDRLSLLVLASVLMGIAISGMHYTGMLAATFIHDPSLQIRESNLLVSSGVTIVTIFTTLLLLGLALATSVVQRILALRQRRSEEVLTKSEEKFRVLVEAVRDYAIFMVDPNGLITTWNSGAERIMGYTDEEIIGQHVSVLVPKDSADRDTVSNELVIAQEQGHFEGEVVRQRRDGSKFWANIVIDPLYDKDGKLTGFSKVTRDITQLKEAEERTKSINEELEMRVRERTLALQERESQLRTITNALPILVAQVDRNEKFLFANDSFCDWFQCGPSEIRKLNIHDVLGDDRYSAHHPYIAQVLSGETVTYERNSKSGNRQTILNITFVPEFDADGRVKGFIIVATDVTRYKEIEAQLKSAKEEAEVANATKSAFLANMSHEIRTPLGAVIGFSELMLDGQMSASDRLNTIEIIKRNGKLLSTIINDILDLSKVEAGKLDIEKIDVPLRELLNELVVLLNLEASGKGIRLVMRSEGIVPDIISTDPVRLRQILFNIVGNAIKFTEKGYVSLTVKLAPSDVSKLLFIVQDTGTGIDSEQAARLFSPFTQADVTTTRKFGGTGLGLVLSKKLANALGGDVILKESSLGVGSTFVISIEHGQSKEVVIESIGEPQVNGKIIDFSPRVGNPLLLRMKVLIVDDSPDNLALIKRILTIAGAKVETANNGREGIEKALRGDFSLVLMDLQMPDMDGFQATQELRQRGFNRPIIALTAHAMKEERKRCFDLGFNDHLTKPVDRDALIDTISSYLA
jgi:PAS domain S-box-containing protein